MKYNCIDSLTRAGISHADAVALRRISMTLHRWHENECGTKHGHIEQNETTGEWSYVTNWFQYGKQQTHRHRIADREAGAKKRLAKIMARYPAMSSYIQGDPRGAALYILRPGDVREGQSIDSCYSNGVAVYK